MDVIILFCAVVLIYVAAAFAFFRVIWRHEKKHQIRHIVMLIGTSLGSWYAAHFLKNLIAYPRPDLSQALFLPVDISSYGLPSGHTAFMVALAATMYTFDKHAGRALYIFAILTGVSRAVAGVHFWYDILGGAVLGYVISYVVVYLCKRLIRKY